MQDEMNGAVGSPVAPTVSGGSGMASPYQNPSLATNGIVASPTPTRVAMEPVSPPPPPPTEAWRPPVTQAPPPPPVPPTEPPKLAVSDVPSDLPVPVVQALSVRGVEYTMMTLTLWFAAGAIIWSLLGLANGLTSFSAHAFPVSLLIVCVPIFAFFFIRLRKAELANPALRFDASKRRLSQFTQVFAFSACLFNLIGFVYLLVNMAGGESSMSIGKSALNLVIVLGVAGGILAYYWFDEHRLVKR